MAKATRETKGPVGEEAPLLDPPDIGEIAAAQAKQAELLAQLGALVIETAAKNEVLAQRVEGLEQAVIGLVQVLRQMHIALPEVLAARRF
jgi:hypothetical protein